MNLDDFARTILFESSLEAKLIGAGSFEIRAYEALKGPPDTPGRPLHLALRPRGEMVRTPFPNASDLEDPLQRGIVLHFFANHELLAMELMALAILRFPEAPPAFLLGIAQTIKEEQTHMRLYTDRMRELGISFGDVPVSRFFWDAIAPMRSPMDYVTQMSMTLEQANLDYSLHYRDLFASLGDQTTSAILDRVYREEIGHVKHGVVWFERWRDQSKSQWHDFLARAQPPMAASRAKGIGFDRLGRTHAGLTPEFIEELAVYRHSKGRPPVVFYFNPACEEEVADAKASFHGNRAVQDITHDLASLMMFVASDDDVVLVSEKPKTAFLQTLQDAEFSVPQFALEGANTCVPELKGRLVSHVEPWGQSPQALAKITTMNFATCLQAERTSTWAVFAKDWSAKLAAALTPEGPQSQVMSQIQDIDAFVEAHFASKNSPLVLKAPLGTSGRNMQRVLPPGLSDQQRRWLEKILLAQGCVVIEPWLNRIVDLSVQLKVSAPNATTGSKSVLGLTRFLTDKRGQYIGHRLGRKFDDLPSEWLKALYGNHIQDRLLKMGASVATALSAAGYRGPAGIDSFLYLEDGEIKLREIVEINSRYTMGRIAFEIDRKIHGAAPALWLHLNLRQVREAGFTSFSVYADAMRKRFPLQLKNHLISSGALATNDPEQARQVLSLLFVGNEAVGSAYGSTTPG